MLWAAKKLQIHILILVLAVFLLSSSQPFLVEAQEPGNEASPAVEEIFNQLTPQERVGQLFMVSFSGTNVADASNIAELIQTYHVGGVVISARNENFTNNDNTPRQILNLTNRLQSLASTILAIFQ